MFLTPLKCNPKFYPTHPYPFFSKIILLTFFGEKLFCNFHREISGENDFSHGSDLWSFFLGQTCPQTWPMRTMSDLTMAFFPVMRNYSVAESSLHHMSPEKRTGAPVPTGAVPHPGLRRRLRTSSPRRWARRKPRSKKSPPRRGRGGDVLVY